MGGVVAQKKHGIARPIAHGSRRVVGQKGGIGRYEAGLDAAVCGIGAAQGRLEQAGGAASRRLVDGPPGVVGAPAEIARQAPTRRQGVEGSRSTQGRVGHCIIIVSLLLIPLERRKVLVESNLVCGEDGGVDVVFACNIAEFRKGSRRPLKSRRDGGVGGARLKVDLAADISSRHRHQLSPVSYPRRRLAEARVGLFGDDAIARIPVVCWDHRLVEGIAHDTLHALVVLCRASELHEKVCKTSLALGGAGGLGQGGREGAWGAWHAVCGAVFVESWRARGIELGRRVEAIGSLHVGLGHVGRARRARQLGHIPILERTFALAERRPPHPAG